MAWNGKSGTGDALRRRGEAPVLRDKISFAMGKEV